jgi:hypothetical protein
MMRMHRPLLMLKRLSLMLLGSIVLGAIAYLQIFWG